MKALLERETLGEQEILDVTGLPPAPALPGTPLSAHAPAEAPATQPGSDFTSPR